MTRFKRHRAGLLCGSIAYLTTVPLAPGIAATPTAEHDKLELRAYVNDSCIIADEPFFIPTPAGQDAADAPKFLPLLGVVIGKLAELFISHEMQSSVDRLKSSAARKDTRYALRTQINLYRATFEPAPLLALNPHLSCMTIVAAKFQPEPVNCAATYLPKELSRESVGLPQSAWKTSRADASPENQLKRANICVDGKLRAVYEARFEFSEDGTAYRLTDAGFSIESLLTTEDPKAVRNTIYTLKVSDPGASDQSEVLSSAWVDLGAVKAGMHSPGGTVETSPWLRVPPLSPEARRRYEARTHLYQEVGGDIEALERAHIRNQRLLAGLDERMAAADPEVAAGLKSERLKVAVQEQQQDAELDARRAEYQDLPHDPLEFMPVNIEVAVTETESADKARLALAEMLGTVIQAVKVSE